jgi:hypothetical protein
VIEREVLVKAEQGAPDSAFVQITGFQIETSTGTRELSSRQLGRFLRCAHHRVEPPGLAVIGQRFYGESGPSLLRIRLNVQLPFGIAVREDLERPSAALNVALTTTATLVSQGLARCYHMHHGISERSPLAERP